MKAPDKRVIRLDYSFDRIQDILSKVKLASGEELFLIDSKNSVLFAKDPAQVLVKPFGKISNFTDWDSADDGEAIETAKVNHGTSLLQRSRSDLAV